jgi:hypothetical protein
MPCGRSVLRIIIPAISCQKKTDILAVDNAILIGFIHHLRSRKAMDKTFKNYSSAALSQLL